MEAIKEIEDVIGRRKYFRTVRARNVEIELFDKMNDKKLKEDMSYSHQIRTALKYWYDNEAPRKWKR